MTVLIITGRRDPTADRVVHTLNETGAQVLRMDFADFPARAALTARLQREGWRGALRVGARLVDLDEVAGVYYRRPTPPQVQAPGADGEYLAAEITRGVGGVLAAIPERLWLGHPRRIAAVDASKPWQLAAAAAEGLAVPASLVTGDTGEAIEFAIDVGGHVAIKPFTSKPARGPDGDLVIYTRRVTPERLAAADLGGIPHQLQAWIDAAHAVRVLTVDGEHLAVRIHLGSAAALVDWRSDYTALAYERIAMPEAVGERLGNLIRGFGLRLAATDFLVDAAGTWWYLETNANGQWAWIECVADEIAAAIARALTDAPALVGADR